MRLTVTLLRQHLGWHFKNKWNIQGQRVIKNTEAEEILSSLGKIVHNPDDILYEKKELQRINVIGFTGQDKSSTSDEQQECLSLGDDQVAVEGLDQMKVLTKTVETEQCLPSKVEELIAEETPKHYHKLVKRCILSSSVFDAYQEKLPHIRDPNRPAFKFPRVYGITQSRKARLTATRLVQLCENLVRGSSAKSSVVEDERVRVFIEKENDLIQFDMSVDLAHIHTSPLKPLGSPDDTVGIALPDIYPFSSTVSLETKNYNEKKDVAFINAGSSRQFINTAVIYFDETKVANLHETPVTETQILGRTLAKAFAVGAVQAKRKYGDDVKDLPEPVTVQCVQTDGQLFHFTVFQLNTLDLNGTEGVKNIMWNIPRIPLYDSCKYADGKPVLEGYNPEVFNKLLGFVKHSVHS